MPIPFTSDQLIGIALSHQVAGRLPEAEAIYRQVISTAPTNARALDLLGVLAVQTDRLAVAEAMLRRAVAAAPDVASYRCNLGECLRRSGMPEQAVEQFSHAVRLTPDLGMAHNNLGIALADLGRLEEAAESYRRCLALMPDFAKCYSNLGNALGELERYEEALVACRKAIELAPDWPDGYNNLGALLALMGKTDDAIAAYDRALELNPDFADACSNLGNALGAKGWADQAVGASRRAVQLAPQSVQSHWNYAVALLRAGDLPGGFREYEWRWVKQEHYPFPKQRFKPPRFAEPHWNGGPIYGLTILLHAEQGFGDTVHFVRYVPLVAARGAKVVLEVPPELRRLLRNIAGAVEVISRGEPIPPVHQHCPLMSLPLAFGTTLATIPAEIPYVAPDAELVREWSERVERAAGEIADIDQRTVDEVPLAATPSNSAESTSDAKAVSRIAGVGPVPGGPGHGRDAYDTKQFSLVSPDENQLRHGPDETGSGTANPKDFTDVQPPCHRLRVGLCWAGSPDHHEDRIRSIPLANLAPLASDRVLFFSLQKGSAAEQITDAPRGMALIDSSDLLTDFADTAALIANLDLVITVDTAVAHVAGAMGKPVWVLMRALADWRWLTGRTDTPWYPTMRLFRQTTSGDWNGPIAEVAEALRECAGDRSRPQSR